MDTQPAISTDDLTKTYSETTAVNSLNLTVERGAVYGFLGPNGAGKTMTIRMLTALLPPTSGSGRVAGTSITDREALIEHIGYLPESPPIHEELTGREQLEYHGGLRNMPPANIDDRIETLLARFELTDAADQRIATYSKGMRQKTGLIQAIMHDPDVVFLDEPTSGLDPRAARTVRETITNLAAEDTTVFLSTHILPVVEEIATNVGILYEGDLVVDVVCGLDRVAELSNTEPGVSRVPIHELVRERDAPAFFGLEGSDKLLWIVILSGSRRLFAKVA